MDSQSSILGRRACTAAGVAAVAGLAGLLARPASNAPPKQRAAQGSRFPDVPLLTHEGRSVRFYSDLVRGRTVLVNMMYAQCNERCPPMTQNLKLVQQALAPRLGRDVSMYSISLLPEHDRPADLAAYMQLHGVGPGWTFLTGARADVEAVRYALGFYSRDPQLDGDVGQHTGMVRIGNEPLDRWCMVHALQETETILQAMEGLVPLARVDGRTRVA
ncbi:SCO family protein [Ramlibacter henchirensis]|uniref:SCO family protein n=1 Tax=Ramlibacter henchirensis TaxID=204072 RepID=A0A4Z0C3H1_9BURK|nr:SCO family protein [Ramlibacter henchirensis]TFZ05482.1 SCO family protein [Ramlibacter henchirensis]